MQLVHPLMPVLPVFGPDAPLAPVYVDDVAEAIARAVEYPGAHGGKTYELGGPETVTMMELNQRIAARERIANDAKRSLGGDSIGVIALKKRDPFLRQERAHGGVQ